MSTANSYSHLDLVVNNSLTIKVINAISDVDRTVSTINSSEQLISVNDVSDGQLSLPITNTGVVARVRVSQDYNVLDNENLLVSDSSRLVSHSFDNYLDVYDNLAFTFGNANVTVTQYVLDSQEFVSAGTYTWTVPAGVTSISVAGVGGGGGGSQKSAGGTGGAGGALTYVNTVSVTPGDTYTVVIGAGGTTGGNFGVSGGDTYMFKTTGNTAPILLAAGGRGGDSMYWTDTSGFVMVSTSPTSMSFYTFQATSPLNQTITYSFSGTLPGNVTVNSSTGVLGGVPETVGNVTNYPITVSAVTTAQTITKPFTLIVTPLTEVTYVALGGNTLGTATTGSFTLLNTAFVDIWGCAGGGSTIAPGAEPGAGGGGGGASQLNGYRLTGTPGETLTYSIGSYGQPTTISRGGTVIFQLNAGGNTTNATGGAGGTANIYSSHAGGAGANGGGRFAGGSTAANVTGCAGGGGGGGYGDNSPYTIGGAGGNGGASSVPAGSICIGSTGGTGGGRTNPPTRGGNVLLAEGGRVTNEGWQGMGGGAGAGIKINAISTTNFYGGGAGGAGAVYTANQTPGGPGCLYVYWNANS